MKKILSLLAASILLTSCATPTVNLSTPEPVKVDIEMRLDVYQHGVPRTAPLAAVNAQPDPVAARRKRMAEVQALKNARLAGEGRDGLLSLRVVPAGDYGDWARATIQSENADRMALMKSEATRLKLSLPQIQDKQARVAHKMAFKGEWIEVVRDKDKWEWIQKAD